MQKALRALGLAAATAALVTGYAGHGRRRVSPRTLLSILDREPSVYGRSSVSAKGASSNHYHLKGSAFGRFRCKVALRCGAGLGVRARRLQILAASGRGDDKHHQAQAILIRGILDDVEGVGASGIRSRCRPCIGERRHSHSRRPADGRRFRACEHSSDWLEEHLYVVKAANCGRWRLSAGISDGQRSLAGNCSMTA
jgi:hypothetical protein